MTDKRDPRVDPKVSDVVRHREGTGRRVAVVFTDACGIPHVWYDERRLVKLKGWQRWAKNAAVINAAE